MAESVFLRTIDIENDDEIPMSSVTSHHYNILILFNLLSLMNKCIRHPGRTQSNVCIKNGCPSDRLCCSGCIVEHHRDHNLEELIELEDFMNILGKNRLERAKIDKENEGILKELEANIGGFLRGL